MTMGEEMSRFFVKPNVHFEIIIENYIKEEFKEFTEDKISCENKYYIDLVREWLETPGSEFLGISKNKLDDIVVILYRYNDLSSICNQNTFDAKIDTASHKTLSTL